MTTRKMTTSNTAPNPAHTAQPACSACGHHGADEFERYELAMEWLLPGPKGTPAAWHFCRACAPGGDVDEITCTRCGDGPLLAGPLTHLDLHVTATVDAHLAAHGWRTAGPVCPDCLADLAR